jgi:hypothetical protein
LSHGVKVGLHTVLLVRTGKICRELCAELTPGLDGSRSEVHELGPGWPGQGYMKVTFHDGVVTPSRRDGGDVDLQEFLRVGGPVIIFRQVGPKVGRPGDRAMVVCERCVAHAQHWHLSESLWPSHGRIELGRKIPTLNVGLAVARSLDGDTGVLSRTSVVELCPEILGPCTPF